MRFELKLIKIIIQSILVLGIVGFGIQTYISSLIVVHQSSMNPTLYDGDLLLTNKLTYQISNPQVGDIVILYKDTPSKFASTRLGLSLEDLFSKIFNQPERTRYVKRVVAIGGDTVDIKNGSLYVNGEIVNENYTKGFTYTNETHFPITIDEDCVYVLGDNREISLDSRNFGQVPIHRIESKVESVLPW